MLSLKQIKLIPRRFYSFKQPKNTELWKYRLGCISIQQRLKFLNLFNTQPDGVFGPGLQAVKELQKQAGMLVTGSVDANFYMALDDAVYKSLYSREDIQLRRAIDI